MLSLDEIAADLTVSVNTVKSHVRSIYAKLGVSSRRLAAHEHGPPQQRTLTQAAVTRSNTQLEVLLSHAPVAGDLRAVVSGGRIGR